LEKKVEEKVRACKDIFVEGKPFLVIKARACH